MPIHQPSRNEMSRRLAAFRTLNAAEVARFRGYVRSGRGSYEVDAPGGVRRSLAASDVAPYIIGNYDAYVGMAEHVREALGAALADPQVVDAETMVATVMSRLYTQAGTHMESAAAYFPPPDEEPRSLPMVS